MSTPVRERVSKWRENKKKEGGKSITVILNPEVSQELDMIREKGELKTIADVVNVSISLYKQLLDGASNGYEVYLVPSKKLKEVSKKKGEDGPRVQQILFPQK